MQSNTFTSQFVGKPLTTVFHHPRRALPAGAALVPSAQFRPALAASEMAAALQADDISAHDASDVARDAAGAFIV